MQRYDGRLTTPLSLPPYCNAFIGFLRFLAECEFALQHFLLN
jgi:hypothetical protein